MLCYRCGSHVPETSETCPTCGQKYDTAARQAAGGFSRRRAEDAPYKPGDVIALRYAVRAVVGSGPLGFVFKAHDEDMDVEVALKVVHSRLVQAPEERTQFSQVVRNGRRLTHPHLMRVYEEGLDGDCPYFTMQLLEGGTTLRRMMDARAARGQRFSLQEVGSLLVQVASALDHAHRLGPHGDLKPENVLVLPDLVRVTDHGLGLAVPRLPFIQAQKHFRADGYIAPEYLAGGEFDTRMDLYSLAVIVGEMLTGLRPSEGVPPELLRTCPELPPALEALYRRALNPNPLARPRTAGEFLKEFSAIVAGEPLPVPVAEGAPPAAARLRAPARPGASGSHASLVAAARRGDKPPPPVPTDQLPAMNFAASAPAPRTAPRAQPPPVDATQPMDMAAVQRMLQQEQPPVDATQPMDAAMLATILSATVAPPEAAAAPPGVAAPAPARPEPKVSQSMVWLVLLALAGMVTGAAGGYFVLSARQQPAEPGAPSVAPPASGQHERKAVAPPPAPHSAAPAVVGTCPAGMRLVAGGPFPMGTAPDERTRGFDERPLTQQEVPSFCMDEFEFPNIEGGLPRVDVSWTEAKGACEHVGKRLCTEEEWEKACKGPGHTRFPYGNTFDAASCNTEDAFGDDRSLAPSGKFAKCRSGDGVADLSGNVAEWTATPYTNHTDMTQKGGAFDRPDYAARCSARKNGAPGDRSSLVGFRCCSDVQP